MRVIKYSIICLLAVLLLSSCEGCRKKQSSANGLVEDTPSATAPIDIPFSNFDDNWNKLDDSNVLSEEEYDSLKLGSLSFIGSYGDLQYEIGKRIIDQEDRKLLTIKAIASGEISEYLLGYIDNDITDSLLVAYEDNVEYYSQTSSTISHDTITVVTIDHDYSGMEDVADTIVSQYIISPELRFEEIINE